MKVIFTKDVPKYGKKYEVKNVSDGFAMNMLIPRGQAIIATDSALKRVEIMKREEVAEKEIQDDLFRKDIDKLNSQKIVIKVKANAKGHLFAGLDSKSLSKIIDQEYKVPISPESIDISNPIKSTGNHTISIKKGSVDCKIDLEIVSA